MIPPASTVATSLSSTPPPLPFTPAAKSAELGDVRYTVHRMPECPDAQVAMTISLMWRRVLQDSQHPAFRVWAERIVEDCHSQVEKCAAIWQHVKHNIRFQNDEVTAGHTDVPVDPDNVVETIIRPLDMMGYVKTGVAVGDCDDFSSYAAALLTANGIECQFATVGADGRDPNQYTHVYVVAYPLCEPRAGILANPFNKSRVPVDASHGQYCGWEVPNNYGKFREWGPGDQMQWVANMAWLGLGVGLMWAVMKGLH